jgi:hypothetical protein
MPTPTYALRLPKKVQDDLTTIEHVYGAPNGRAFAREILEVVTSGDPDRISLFVAKFIDRLGGQTSFYLTVENTPAGTTRTTRTPSKARKKRRRRERTT